jgi:hypothetical protein
MTHEFDIRLRLQIDNSELLPGETPCDAAERLLREIMTVGDRVLAMHVSSWLWRSKEARGYR